MNLPEMFSYENQAIDTVVNVLNSAKFKVGQRQNLIQLAKSRNEFLTKTKVLLHTLKSPLVRNCEIFIAEAIEKKWDLIPPLKYILRYMGNSQDESTQYLYYEAVFSQPSISYPIPQAQVSVYFRLENKHIEPPEVRGVPTMVFRIEGQNTEHDVRFVSLTVDWILAVIQMKIKIFKRIEALNVF